MNNENEIFIGAGGLYTDSQKAKLGDKIKAPQHDEIDLCKEWLLEYGAKIKQINRRSPSSYALKHYVEDWLRAQGRAKYISNGAFIQAAIDLGYDYENLGLNARFNLAKKGVTRFLKEIGRR